MSIIGKVQELQALIVEKYGAQADVKIVLSQIGSPELTRELANYISHDVAGQYKDSDIYSYANKQQEGTNWVEFYAPEERFTFVAFYDVPVAREQEVSA